MVLTTMERIRKHREAVRVAKEKGIVITGECVKASEQSALVSVLEGANLESDIQVEAFLALYHACNIVKQWIAEHPDEDYEIFDPFDGMDDEFIEGFIEKLGGGFV